MDSSSAKNKIQNLESELKEKDTVIEQLQFQISQMQRHFQDWIERTDTKSSASKPDDEQNVEESSAQTHVAEIPISEDQPYFTAYAHFDIHHTMLSVSRAIHHITFLLSLNLHTTFDDSNFDQLYAFQIGLCTN